MKLGNGLYPKIPDAFNTPKMLFIAARLLVYTAALKSLKGELPKETEEQTRERAEKLSEKFKNQPAIYIETLLAKLVALKLSDDAPLDDSFYDEAEDEAILKHLSEQK